LLGSNEQAARACGIATDRLKDLDLWTGGLIVWPRRRNADVAIATGRPDRAAGSELDIIAAVVMVVAV